MPTYRPIRLCTSDPARHGGGILVALVMLIALAALMVASTDNVTGVYRQLHYQGIEADCKSAAEAVCSSKENQLVILATEGDHKKLTDPDYQNYGEQWFGNCLVRWRIEPFLVEEPDPANVNAPRYIANPDPLMPIPAGAEQPNDDFYHYRIATESTYRGQGNEVLSRAQAFRWVQISRQPLFRYALFYAQEGSRGDLEICHGPEFTVRGGVHSNGAIYIGGASSPEDPANINGGDATHLGKGVNKNGTLRNITVTGVDGIFRQRKATNSILRGGAGYVGSTAIGVDIDPMLVIDPTLHMTTTNRFINEQVLDPAQDSRSAGWKTTSMATFDGFVRTAVTGASVVKTLSNIPEMAGRPLEAQRLTDAANEDARLARAYANPAVDWTETTGPVVHAAFPVHQVNGLYVDYALGIKDTDAVAYTTATATAYTHTITGGDPDVVGLLIRERPNQDTTIYPGASTCLSLTGLPTDGMPLPATRPLPNDYLAGGMCDARNFETDLSLYLKSQYQAFLGKTDITDIDVTDAGDGTLYDGFFDCRPLMVHPDHPALPAARTRPVEESEMLNRRLFWSQKTFDTKADYLALPANRQSILTLNLDVIQSYLRYVDASVAIKPGLADKVRDHFNGLIYVHRTPRATPSEWALYTKAVRIARAARIDWQHNDTVNDPLGTSKLTIVTPNAAFLWGNVNSVIFGTPTEPIATPMALMADSCTVLSPDFVDADQNLDGSTGVSVDEVTYNLALVLNNWPIGADNDGDDASAHTFVWWLENWGGKVFNYKGSVVVLNSRRYARGYNQGATRTRGIMPAGEGNGPPLYGAPKRVIDFNEDLRSKAGTPPFTPFGVNITRQANYVVSLGRY